MTTEIKDHESCGQDKCDRFAAYRFTWPGKDESFICEGHVTKLLSVADAMGLYVQVIPLVRDHAMDPRD